MLPGIIYVSWQAAQVLELANLVFNERSENAVLLGPGGVGKSNIAMSLGCGATQAGIRTRFITAADLLLVLTTANRQNQLADVQRRLVNPYRLLIIDLDEIGYLPMSREAASKPAVLPVDCQALQARQCGMSSLPATCRSASGTRPMLTTRR